MRLESKKENNSPAYIGECFIISKNYILYISLIIHLVVYSLMPNRGLHCKELFSFRIVYKMLHVNITVFFEIKRQYNN